VSVLQGSQVVSWSCHSAVQTFTDTCTYQLPEAAHENAHKDTDNFLSRR
jgi:hypothetical protein